MCCIVNYNYAQERFFTFVEGWISMVAVEYEDKYIIIGTGNNSSNMNNVQFNELNNTGELNEFWQLLNISGTISSDLGTQQCFTEVEANNRRIMGITVRTDNNVVKSRRLIFDKDLLEVLDSSWTYQPPQGEQSDIFVSYYQQPDKILHGVHYYTGSTINSTLLSTDTLGNIIWESNFSCGNNSCWMEPRHIHPAHDGGYIFTHTEERNSNNGWSIDDHDVANIIKTDSLGIEQWRIHPGGEGNPYTSEHILLQPTDDGNYLCAWADNWIKTTNVGHYNLNPDATIWFAKIAPDGNKIWEKNIVEDIQIWGTEEVIYVMDQMIRLPDGNFALISIDQIIKINQNAEVIWARRVRPPELINTPEQYSEFYIKGISVTSDGGFICTGELQIDPGDIYPEYMQTGFALKLDEYGCLEEGCQEDDPLVSVEVPVLSEHKLLIYPNPANEYVTIDYTVSKSDAADLSIIITDILGQQVYQEKLSYPQDEVIIMTNQLPQGQYFCILKDSNEVIKTDKFIVTK